MRMTRTGRGRFVGLLAALVATAVQVARSEQPSDAEYYIEPPLFPRPDPRSEMHFGHIGVTGLKVHLYEGVTVKVEATDPGTPADGKFGKGDVISGINGVALKGRNPFVVIGSALTAAEAGDGRLVFDVQAAGSTEVKPVLVTIPVLGAYSPTWPLDCRKSQAIVAQAAAYYAKTLRYPGESAHDMDRDYETHGIGGALACLFLLSTGDDRYLPRVKAYFDEMARDPKAIGDHTWNNGYNGIACAEYYLRTGDAAVLPVLQYYCDNARDRQFYGIGWAHWGRQINPGYVAGGLMNPAAAQVATTLLLAKECGVRVDEPTMLGALCFFYRFAGHGSVAYGDHRGEGGLGSNGKDGMAAAIMQVACDARGDVSLYRQARDYLAMTMMESYPKMVTGHGDNGRGDAIWRAITSAYVLEVQPATYHAEMNRLRWWYDLSRRPSGGIGVATCQRFDDEGSGAAVAMAYTAPLRTLRITGAPRSRYAKDFALPECPWGRKADRDFLSIEHGAPYWRYGTNQPIDVPLMKLGNAYSVPTNATSVARTEVLQNVYHWNYMIRAQAAKVLMHSGAFGDLETLLRDPDPRVRRAALDGLTDYRYWFGIGKSPIRPEDVSPAMLAAMRSMLADPNEALYVVDGALLALSRAPAAEIAGSVPLILPWTTNEEWWVREGAFLALAAAAPADGCADKVLPVLSDMLLHERRAQAREVMSGQLAALAKTVTPDSATGKQVVAAFERAAGESEIKSGPRAGEGGHYVATAVEACLKTDPGSAVAVARITVPRLPQLEARQLTAIVEALLSARAKLPEPAREELTGILSGAFLHELVGRMGTGGAALDTILSLTQLRHPDAGWRPLGKPASDERVFRFMSFEPRGKDVLDPREGKRFRDVALPAGLESWFQPDFDASGWAKGRGPIGKGVYKAKRGKAPPIENRSTWGDGEILLARSTFELEALDCDYYRVGILANQGYHIYLNGHRIHTYIWWQDAPVYRSIQLGPDEAQYLTKGTNVLAVYANAAYPGGLPVGQFDIRLEGLKQADILREATSKERQP